MEVIDINILRKDLEHFVNDVLTNEPVENQQNIFDKVSNGNDKVLKILQTIACIHDCRKKVIEHIEELK